MLVTFSCEAYENITMFGEVAKHLLTLMGHSGTIPGALVAEEVSQALANLEKGIAQEKSKNTYSLPYTIEEDSLQDEPISLANRALPLINMLKAANKQQCNVLWR